MSDVVAAIESLEVCADLKLTREHSPADVALPPANADWPVDGSKAWDRTMDRSVNSRELYR
jgi:hypothetical protein